MKKRAFLSYAATVMAAALLLCGCQSDNDNDNGHIEDIDLVGDISETTTTTAAATAEPPEAPDGGNISWFTAFIMPENPSSTYVYALGEENCVPGYMYLKGQKGAVYPLLDMHFSYSEEVFQSDTHAYAVNDENGSRLLKINKLTGEYEVLYEAESGVIDNFKRSKRGDNAGRIYYLTDGNRVVHIYRDSDKAEVIAESESGVVFMNTPGEDGLLSGSYSCEECIEKGDYIFWRDNGDKIYWYHGHTGENMLLDNSYMWELKFYQSGVEVEFWTLNDLYFHNIYTDEEILIAENVPNFEISGDTAFIEVEKGDGAPYILAAYIPARETEIVYTPQYGDIKMVSYIYHTDDFLIIRDGDYLLRMDTDTLEVTTLFRLDNGMANSSQNQSVSDRVYYTVYSADHALLELELLKSSYDEFLAEDYPDMDFNTFYCCEDCIDDPNAFYWKDANGDFWWYHAHSGENEPINADEYWVNWGLAHFITRKNQ